METLNLDTATTIARAIDNADTQFDAKPLLETRDRWLHWADLGHLVMNKETRETLENTLQLHLFIR